MMMTLNWTSQSSFLRDLSLDLVGDFELASYMCSGSSLIILAGFTFCLKISFILLNTSLQQANYAIRDIRARGEKSRIAFGI